MPAFTAVHRRMTANRAPSKKGEPIHRLIATCIPIDIDSIHRVAQYPKIQDEYQRAIVARPQHMPAPLEDATVVAAASRHGTRPCRCPLF